MLPDLKEAKGKFSLETPGARFFKEACGRVLTLFDQQRLLNWAFFCENVCTQRRPLYCGSSGGVESEGLIARVGGSMKKSLLCEIE
jgi:hypothetical protein